MMAEAPARSGRAARRRTVATRVLLSYAVVSVAFAVVAGWAVLALRGAAQEAELIRSGYLPSSLALRSAVAGQDSWNSQLNHITTAKNPADKRVWFDAALRVGRPKTFAEVRASLSRAFVTSEDGAVKQVGLDLSREATRIEHSLAPDRGELGELFVALAADDSARAEKLRDSLVTRGLRARKRLSELEGRVQRNVDSLLDRARERERLALRLLVALAAFTLLVGVAAAFYAARLLRPLGAVTERAKAVARGDLTPREVVAAPDEIGELATTFEGMVSAIARGNVRLLASERLATIGRMAARVTHEVRNPLSSIGLNVELLEEDTRDEEQLALIRAIKAELDRLTQLTAEYLSVARRKEPDLQEEDLGQLVEEVCSFVLPELQRARVRLEVDVADALPQVRIDEAQLRQALQNLLRNAREALPQGGSVAVRLRPGTDEVVLAVEDDGPGMDTKTRERLFEPFFTTKSQGTGLGLAITAQILEAHGGRIECETVEPHGTRFLLYFPVEK